MPATSPPRPMPPIAIRAFSATTALGHGVEAQAGALAARRGGLRRNDFGPSPLPTWIGRVDGIEDAPLPEALAAWECRNNRLAWLALQQDGLREALEAAVSRHGADRVALVVGTSTSSIGASEEGYARATVDAQGQPCFPPDLQRPMVHTLHSLGDFLQHATGVRGPCMTVATACSSSAKVFAQAARLIHAGGVYAALVGGVDTLCGSVLFGFNALGLVSAEPCRPFDASRDGLSLGEAGGFAVLERAAPDEDGLQLRGYGESSDAHHMSRRIPRASAPRWRCATRWRGPASTPAPWATSTCTAPRPRPTTRSRHARSPRCSPIRCTPARPRAGPGTPWARPASSNRCSR